MGKSNAELMEKARLMLAGLKNNSDRLSKRGLDSAFITKLESSINNAVALDAEQEDLKAKAKMKTEECNKQFDELNVEVAEARKIVKIEMEQGNWGSFGITDKK